MKFNKPPVVEVWISVEFEPNEKKREWDLELVQEYARRCESEFPTRERQLEGAVEVQLASPNDPPKMVVHKDVRLKSIRLWNKQRTRMLRLGDDEFAFHVLRSADETPRFSTAREAAEPKLRDYVQIFAPAKIRNATLHYLDVIEIPQPAGGTINLSDYFPLVVDPPDSPFGQTVSLSHQFHVMCPTDFGPLLFRLQLLPSSPEQGVFRFQMEWHKVSLDVNTLDLQAVWERMGVAHDYLRDCFKAALSESTLRLFDPVN